MIVPARPSDQPRCTPRSPSSPSRIPLINLRQDDTRATDVRLALWRGAERSDRPRWRAISASLSNSGKRRRSASSVRSAPARRSRQSASRPIRSSRPSTCASIRRRSIPASNSAWRSARLDPAAVPPGGRGHGEGDPAPGAIWMAGHRLHGHHDAFRLQQPGTSVAADFRNLTPLVLMDALKRPAPGLRADAAFRLEAPADTLGSLLPVLSRLNAIPQTPVMRGASCVLEGEISRRPTCTGSQQQVPRLTRGEACWNIPSGATGRCAARSRRGRVGFQSRSTARSTCSM